MPGIFGLIDKTVPKNKNSNKQNLNFLNSMASVMQYESFYHIRQYNCDEMGVYVGWAGLAESSMNKNTIIDRPDGLSLFISGEPYLNVELGKESVYEEFQHGGECQHIVNCYLRFGERFLERIDGQFSGLIVDKQVGLCLLFNDRMGLERLYLYETTETVVFSSEAKAILACFPETRAYDSEGLSQFLVYGGTFWENSLFRKIRVLPGGSVVKFIKGRPYNIRKYFDRYEWEYLEPLKETEFVDRFRDTMKSILRMYLTRYTSVAVSLTGGIDSRMIMACLNELKANIPCYTFGSMYRETYDVFVAKKVAEYSSQPHQVLVLDVGFLSEFEKWFSKAVRISDGYLGFPGAAELYLNVLSRAIAPIRVTGNFGGEILRRGRVLRCSIPDGNFLKPELLKRMNETIILFSRMNEMQPLSSMLFIQAPSRFGRYAIERSQAVVLSPFLERRLVELFYRKPVNLRSNEDPSIALINRCDSDLLTIPTDRGLLGTDSVVKRKTRRLLREATFKLEIRMGHGMPNSIARISRFGLGLLGERLLMGRHKFLHFRTWIKRELANYMKELILGDLRTNLDEYIDFSYVKKMVLDHLKGKRNYTKEIDMVGTLLLTERLLLKAEKYQETGKRNKVE